MKIKRQFTQFINSHLTKHGFYMRAKLIIIFVAVMVIPLLVFSLLALHQYQELRVELNARSDGLKSEVYQAVTEMGSDAAGGSVLALDNTINGAIDGTEKLIGSSIASIWARLVLFTLLMLAVAVLISVFLASVFSKSIMHLVDGISRFREGERQFRFKPQVLDELGTLAEAFDEMADGLAEADRGLVVTINNDMKIIYANDIALKARDKKLEEICGRPYSEMSFYPRNSIYDPIAALHEGRETEIMYNKELGAYYRGKASFIVDKLGKNIGYVVTSFDITDMMVVQNKLKQAVADAELANEHKGNFLARMSHELRTPMNAIIGMSRIARKKIVSGNFNVEEIKANLDQVESSSHHLLGLLNDILDITKIESGKIELLVEATDILKLAQTVAAIIQPRCKEKNISFEADFDLPEETTHDIDALRLRQVLTNLLGNAVKFTDEGGKVSFNVLRKSCEGNKARIDFIISDTGIGIPEDSLVRIFEPFTQVENEAGKNYGGTGLGLGISRSIVRMFGGEIAVKSEAGKGSEFSFSLVLNENQTNKTEDAPIENKAGLLKGKRALLVDDVEINRIVAISMLESTGISVDEAGNGIEAVNAFSENGENYYDIIYMDVQMPEMDGYEAAQAIRALERPDAKNVPIVALTANAFKDDIDKAIASGMNAHLAKPMDMEKIMEVTLKLTMNN